jgi:hypothetical protein
MTEEKQEKDSKGTNWTSICQKNYEHAIKSVFFIQFSYMVPSFLFQVCEPRIFVQLLETVSLNIKYYEQLFCFILISFICTSSWNPLV